MNKGEMSQEDWAAMLDRVLEDAVRLTDERQNTIDVLVAALEAAKPNVDDASVSRQIEAALALASRRP